MRLSYLLVAATLLAVSTVTVSASTKGEQTLTLDLTALPEGQMYYLKCHAFGSLPCVSVSLWTQTNELKGLQTGIYGGNGKAYEADRPLLS